LGFVVLPVAGAESVFVVLSGVEVELVSVVLLCDRSVELAGIISSVTSTALVPIAK
jgi:hypothetical protein